MKKKKRKKSPAQEWVTRRNWTKGKLINMETQLGTAIDSCVLTRGEIVAAKRARGAIREILYFWEGNRIASRGEYLWRKEA